ncbi:aldolase/citrate lyase family protein, partial [uncultured Methylobacterium sp.]|uniref:aldolase/citrate lyase family protein n=1 Tax=uncultured Methylobacterium sp. TaxID=157278 RepID=UPI002595A516
MTEIRPRRSVLSMPGSNARALEKARGLPCDVVMIDLEDAVAPEAKAEARASVAAAVAARGFGRREVVVRINPLDGDHGEDDLAALAPAGPDAILVPKVTGAEALVAVGSRLRRLKALGVHIAMDDFGSGYSSLTYLQAFPFDKIKIDRTFVMNLGRNPQSAAIIRAIGGLGEGLNILIVAEGVETQEQLDFLRQIDCRTIQGYFTGKPG